MCLIVYSNDHAPLTVRLIYSSSKLRTVQMMIFSLFAMIGLAKCCITSACLQWLCHSGERIVARGPLVISSVSSLSFIFLSPLSLSLISSTISSIFPLPFSGRWHKMTHKGWHVVKSQLNKTIQWGYSLGAHHRYTSNEYKHHMFLLRNTKLSILFVDTLLSVAMIDTVCYSTILDIIQKLYC